MNPAAAPDNAQSARSTARTGLLARYLKPAAFTALLVSLAIHLTILTIAALITFSRLSGASGDLANPVEFAVMTAEELAQLQDAALDVSTPSVEELPLPDTPEIDFELSQLEADLTGDTADLEAQLGGGDINDSSLGVSGAGGGSAKFFGVEATGSRFAYVVDVSGSMGVNGKIDRLRTELVRSLDGMLETASFFVCLYNSSASPIGAKAAWVTASDSGKRWANRPIANIVAAGGTAPLPGFEMVFSRRPRPDAVYFMTDGQFDPAVAMKLRFMNAEARIPIHCITFDNRGAEQVMRQIARDSGGTYTHVPGPGG